MKAGDAFVEVCCLIYVSRLAWVSGHETAVVVIWGVGFVLNVLELVVEKNRDLR